MFVEYVFLWLLPHLLQVFLNSNILILFLLLLWAGGDVLDKLELLLVQPKADTTVNRFTEVGEDFAGENCKLIDQEPSAIPIRIRTRTRIN